MSSSQPAPAMELSLEDAWADQLMARFPRLRRVLDTPHVHDLREKRVVPTRDDIGPIRPILDAVREYELVCRSNQLELVDEARLFEAVVIRISRHLFANDEVMALASYEFLETMEAVGDHYQERLDVTITADADEANRIAQARRIARTGEADAPARPEGAEGDVITLDDTGVGAEIVDISKAVAKRLRELNTEEAAVAYSEVKRRSQLLCFCAALWSVEAKRSTKAADVALDERFRRMLSGDAVALFFRSRALLVSPVASTAQTQLGLQFVTTALSFFPRNPGMHHTRALFLLRKSSTIIGEQESFDCLAQALESVEEALKWDAEFPIFYATRAKVKYRQHNRSGALVDLRAAIELARYGVSSRAARSDIATWEALLESWDLAPVGVASGTA